MPKRCFIFGGGVLNYHNATHTHTVATVVVAHATIATTEAQAARGISIRGIHAARPQEAAIANTAEITIPSVARSRNENILGGISLVNKLHAVYTAAIKVIYP